MDASTWRVARRSNDRHDAHDAGGVDRDDPAFARPTKPVGPLYDRVEAERLAHRLGWSIARDGDHWRRVVPSPRSRSIVELATIRILVDRG